MRRSSSAFVAAATALPLLAACGGPPYTTLHDLPLQGWHIAYEFHNTAKNGGCEDGDDCRAYGVISSMTQTTTSLTVALRARGWSCDYAHAPHQVAMMRDQGRWFVEFEPVSEFVRESTDVQEFFDDRPDVHADKSSGELAHARAAANNDEPAVVIEVAHTKHKTGGHDEHLGMTRSC